MCPTLVILGYSQAAQFLRTPDAARLTALISIHGTHEFGIETGVPHRLDLTFDDAPSPDHPDPIAAYHARQFLQHQRDNGRELHPPAPADAQAIITFARTIQNLEGILLCHCNGGISRSPAAALLCLAAWTSPGDEERITQHLRQICPAAQPHPDLIRFGDQILNRGGKLAAATQ